MLRFGLFLEQFGDSSLLCVCAFAHSSFDGAMSKGLQLLSLALHSCRRLLFAGHEAFLHRTGSSLKFPVIVHAFWHVPLRSMYDDRVVTLGVPQQQQEDEMMQNMHASAAMIQVWKRSHKKRSKINVCTQQRMHVAFYYSHVYDRDALSFSQRKDRRTMQLPGIGSPYFRNAVLPLYADVLQPLVGSTRFCTCCQ